MRPNNRIRLAIPFLALLSPISCRGSNDEGRIDPQIQGEGQSPLPLRETIDELQKRFLALRSFTAEYEAFGILNSSNPDGAKRFFLFFDRRARAFAVGSSKGGGAPPIWTLSIWQNRIVDAASGTAQVTDASPLLTEILPGCMKLVESGLSAAKSKVPARPQNPSDAFSLVLRLVPKSKAEPQGNVRLAWQYGDGDSASWYSDLRSGGFSVNAFDGHSTIFERRSPAEKVVLDSRTGILSLAEAQNEDGSKARIRLVRVEEGAPFPVIAEVGGTKEVPLDVAHIFSFILQVLPLSLSHAAESMSDGGELETDGEFKVATLFRYVAEQFPEFVYRQLIRRIASAFVANARKRGASVEDMRDNIAVSRKAFLNVVERHKDVHAEAVGLLLERLPAKVVASVGPLAYLGDRRTAFLVRVAGSFSQSNLKARIQLIDMEALAYEVLGVELEMVR